MHIYEAHVKGLTQLNFDIPKEKRGKFLGVSDVCMIEHLKGLAVDTIQLMPVFKSNGSYWGYDVVDWMKLNESYGTLEEFKQMIEELHSADIKVVLDVVYNHTAKPIKDVKYYDWDVTGCGNTVDVKNSLHIIMESISYWFDIGIDGMRFDLANVLGREGGDFNPEAKFFKEMEEYKDKILIAEPWDCAEYSLGRFPEHWLEINGHFRDVVRSGGEYDWNNSPLEPNRSINFITCHDGFTLDDLVTYSRKHNHTNGEDGRDGCNHNMSSNHGVEGYTNDKEVIVNRINHKNWLRRQLYSSEGHHLTLAGDEVNNTQFGNNNAWNQDNPLGWVIWPS